MSYVLPSCWYRESEGTKLGPYTVPELYWLLETKQSEPHERVQADNGSEWLTIAEVLRRSREGSSSRATEDAGSRGDHYANAPSDQKHPSNYIMRHWRGDLSLGLSYWVNLVLLAALAHVFFAVAGELARAASLSYHQTALLITILVAMAALIAIWQIVGTWRSSERHTSRGGLKFWATAAKVMLILAVLRGGLEMVTSEVPTAINAWQHAALMSSLPPSNVQPLRGGTEIEFSGGIHNESAARLGAVLDQYPRARVVHLTSDGGNLAEGHAMAAIIRSRGLDTYVRTKCLSACTIVFLGGRNRLLRDGAQLGFHAPTTLAAGLRGKEIVAEERAKLARAGLPDWFVTRAFAPTGSAMWFPTVDELRNARAITQTTDGRYLSPGPPTRLMTIDDAERAFRALPLGTAIQRADPTIFRAIVEAMRESMNDGGTEADIASAVERRVTPVFTRSLSILPDHQMVATVATITQVARQLGASNPRICRDWLMHKAGQPIPLIAGHITSQQQTALIQTMADAIMVAADPRQRAASPRQPPPQLEQVFRRLEARLPRGQIQMLETIESPSHPPNIVCSLVVEFYSEILRLPEREAGPLLRFILASG